MKKLLTLLAFLCSVSAFAQDKIDFGKTENQNVPSYQYDGERRLSDEQLKHILEDDRLNSKKSKQLRTIGIIGGIVLTGAGGVLMLTAPSDDGYEEQMIAGGAIMGVGIVGATTCFIVAHNYQKKTKEVQSISLYQQEFKFKNGTSLNPSVDLLKDQAFHHQTIGLGLHYNF